MKKFCCFFICALLSFVHVSADPRTVHVSGETVMIHAQYEGVLVSGEFDFSWNDQRIDKQPYDSIQPGDLITEIGHQKITTCAQLNQILSKTPIDTKYLDVSVKRNEADTKARLYLYYESKDNTFKTGFYIKDHISGVGTLTYIDPYKGTYGALGHEITEKTTGSTADIHKGELMSAEVTSIVSSKINQPGEKISRNTGMLLADIRVNNQFGLYGKISSRIHGKEMPIALQHQIQTGPAVFLTVLNNTEIHEVQIEITKVNHQKTAQVKGIEFKITDENVLKQTGGIVQGMSGSPIVQNGRIIGAVTHMIPSVPNKGYGVFIEWMLMQSDHIH